MKRTSEHGAGEDVKIQRREIEIRTEHIYGVGGNFETQRTSEHGAGEHKGWEIPPNMEQRKPSEKTGGRDKNL